MRDSRDFKISPIDKAKLERTGGQPLPRNIKMALENELRVKLDDIRIHTGPNAQAITRKVGSKAYAVGNHIVFAQGQYQPNSPNGKNLLKHELTHVVQQKGRP